MICTKIDFHEQNLVTYLLNSRSRNLNMRKLIKKTQIETSFMSLNLFMLIQCNVVELNDSSFLNHYFRDFIAKNLKNDLSTILINQQKDVTTKNIAEFLDDATRTFETQKKRLSELIESRHVAARAKRQVPFQGRVQPETSRKRDEAKPWLGHRRPCP